MTRTAVVLFNLGGPDDMATVKPFLFNLFHDRAIINLPQPLRWLAAKLISIKRAGKSRGIYQQIGGKSPILELTQAQADALEKRLGSKDSRVFVCMRYWHPMSRIVVKNVKAFRPDRVILLPLYPQYSTTTTASSFNDWERIAKKEGLNVPTARICCYPADRGFVAAHAKLIKDTYWKASEEKTPRLIFSAHGLPEKVIEGGDPYQWQVEKTVESVIQVLAIEGADWSICYQSRVGMLKWIGPSLDEELARAAQDNVPVVVVPISFVSEHSETLVELDIQYRVIAENLGIPGYWRVPALGIEPMFIETLADLCNAAAKEGTASFIQKRYCHPELTRCPCAA